MNSDMLSALSVIIGVVIGAILTFLSQYFLYQYQEKIEMRKKTIDLKNQQCLIIWKEFSDIYKYLYYVGDYSDSKIDWDGLGTHIKNMNISIIQTQPFISQQGYMDFMKIRNDLNDFILKRHIGSPYTYEEYMAFIEYLDKLIDTALDVIREELQLKKLQIICT